MARLPRCLLVLCSLSVIFVLVLVRRTAWKTDNNDHSHESLVEVEDALIKQYDVQLHPKTNQHKAVMVASRQLSPRTNNSRHIKILSLNSTSEAVKSYVLALGFTEQLSTATHSLLQLGNLASDWNGLLVEPMVMRSHIFGVWKLVSPAFQTGSADDEGVLSFFTLYDQVEVNDYLHSRIDPNVDMVEYVEFLSNASRDVTLIHFVVKVPTTEASRLKPMIVFSPLDYRNARQIRKTFQHNESPVFNCDTTLKFVKDVEEHLNQAHSSVEQSKQFKVSQVLCLDILSVYSSGYLRQYIKLPSTVIFTNWNGCGLRNCTFFNDSSSREFVPYKRTQSINFRYAVLTNALCKDCFVFTQHVLHSSLVRETAANFLRQQLQITQPFLSIHIRLERVIEDGYALNITHYVESCLSELKTFVETITDLKRTLLITDIGTQYGSDSCNKREHRCNENTATLALQSLDSLGFERQHYVPETHNNSAFVSLVEMHSLAAGAKLVLVGRGAFQNTLESLYISLGHKSSDFHRFCN